MNIFDSIFSASGIDVGTFFIMLGAALIIGLIISSLYSIKTKSSKGFLITLTVLPLCVATVIALVSGNIGAGIAVAGAFALIRFRSVQGKAKEICAIFISMASGLACGLGYVAFAALFAIITSLALLLLGQSKIWESKKEDSKKVLKISIPEDVDYTTAFTETFKKYTKSAELVKAKTTNMGSMFKVTYNIELKNNDDEKKFIDELRTLNGNLEIKFEGAVTESYML